MTPYIRLVNNGKSTWFNGRADEGNEAQGDDLLIYPPREGMTDYWKEQMDKLVADGYAEYVNAN